MIRQRIKNRGCNGILVSVESGVRSSSLAESAPQCDRRVDKMASGNVSHPQQSAEEMPEIEPAQKDKKESNEKLITAPSLIIPIQRASSYNFLDLQ